MTHKADGRAIDDYLSNDAFVVDVEAELSEAISAECHFRRLAAFCQELRARDGETFRTKRMVQSSQKRKKQGDRGVVHVVSMKAFFLQPLAFRQHEDKL